MAGSIPRCRNLTVHDYDSIFFTILLFNASELNGPGFDSSRGDGVLFLRPLRPENLYDLLILMGAMRGLGMPCSDPL
jgi:hypothetical protein